jgi:hypothetical protein
MHTYTSPHSSFSGNRGSVLIVALIFASVIAISLGSFLQLANTATKLSYRTHYQGVAMNIAETGLEQAMWELNSTGSSWTGWSSVGTGAYRRSFDLGKVEGGATAVVKVYAQPKVGSAPAWIVARSIISPPKGAPIEKWVKVTLQKRSRGSIGGLGREGITSSGNQVVMGSWNSDPDKDPSTPPIPYSADVANDEMSLATIALDATLASGNADVNGKAAVGSDTTAAIQVGPQGYIGPFGTTAGTKDPDSISANFSADMPLPELPTGKTFTNLGTINTATTLPDGGHTPNDDGIYYYTATEINLNGGALTIAPGKEVVISIDKNSGTAVSVSGNGGAIKVAGTYVTDTSSGVSTYSTGKLKLYTGGDVLITGQGTIVNEITTQTYNPYTSTSTSTVSNVQPVYGKGQQKDTVIGWTYNQSITTETTVGTTTTTQTTSGSYKVLTETGATQPVVGTSPPSTTSGATVTDIGTYVGQADNLRIYGTRTDEAVATYGDQSIKLSGNGSLSAVVDAPNADIEAKGGGNSGFIYGSLAGKSLKFTGNDCFYYDESLSNSDDGARLGIEDWDEMVSYADRTTYASYMNF